MPTPFRHTFDLMEIGEEAGRLGGRGSERSANAGHKSRWSPAPHRYLAQAAEKLGSRDEAIRANQALILFDTTDAADTHFRLAQLLREAGNREAAKRHVLMALEEAPRFLAAHRLLLELANGDVAAATEPSSPEAAKQ